MSKNSSLGAFLHAFWKDWLVQMSGPFAVPLMVISVFATHFWIKMILFFTGLGCGLFSSYWIWKAEREQVITLENEVVALGNKFDALEKSKVNLSLQPIERGGWHQKKGVRAFYLKVTNDHQSKVAKSVSVLLTDISPNDMVEEDWATPLPYKLPLQSHATTESKYTTDINPGSSEFFGVIALIYDEDHYNGWIAPFTLMEDGWDIEAESVRYFLQNPLQEGSINLFIRITSEATRSDFKLMLNIPKDDEDLEKAAFQVVES